MGRYKPQPACVLRPGRKPAGWDLDVEVLASLSIAGPTPLSLLAADFRLEQVQILFCLKRLAVYGVEYRKGGRPGEGWAVIPPRHRSDVSAVCEAYWRKTHEGLPADLN